MQKTLETILRLADYRKDIDPLNNLVTAEGETPVYKPFVYFFFGMEKALARGALIGAAASALYSLFTGTDLKESASIAGSISGIIDASQYMIRAILFSKPLGLDYEQRKPV